MGAHSPTHLFRERRELLRLPSLRFLTLDEVLKARAIDHRLEEGVALVAPAPERHRLVLEIDWLIDCIDGS